jgi:hypothetical protein
MVSLGSSMAQSFKMTDAKGKETGQRVFYGEGTESFAFGLLLKASCPGVFNWPLISERVHAELMAKEQESGRKTLFLSEQTLIDGLGWVDPDVHKESPLGAPVLGLDPMVNRKVFQSKRTVAYFVPVHAVFRESDLRTSVYLQTDEMKKRISDEIHKVLQDVTSSLHCLFTRSMPGFTTSHRYRAAAEAESMSHIGGECLLGSTIRPLTSAADPASGLHYCGSGDTVMVLKGDAAASLAANGLPVLRFEPVIVSANKSCPFKRCYLDDQLYDGAVSRSAGLDRTISPYGDNIVVSVSMDANERQWDWSVYARYKEVVRLRDIQLKSLVSRNVMGSIFD